jgi:hypothetical protein
MISACGEVDSSVSRSAAAFGGAVFSPGGRAETGTNRFADRIGSHWTRLLYNIGWWVLTRPLSPWWLRRMWRTSGHGMVMEPRICYGMPSCVDEAS